MRGRGRGRGRGRNEIGQEGRNRSDANAEPNKDDAASFLDEIIKQQPSIVNPKIINFDSFNSDIEYFDDTSINVDDSLGNENQNKSDDEEQDEEIKEVNENQDSMNNENTSSQNINENKIDNLSFEKIEIGEFSTAIGIGFDDLKKLIVCLSLSSNNAFPYWARYHSGGDRKISSLKFYKPHKDDNKFNVAINVRKFFECKSECLDLCSICGIKKDQRIQLKDSVQKWCSFFCISSWTLYQANDNDIHHFDQILEKRNSMLFIFYFRNPKVIDLKPIENEKIKKNEYRFAWAINRNHEMVSKNGYEKNVYYNEEGPIKTGDKLEFEPFLIAFMKRFN